MTIPLSQSLLSIDSNVGSGTLPESQLLASKLIGTPGGERRDTVLPFLDAGRSLQNNIEGGDDAFASLLAMMVPVQPETPQHPGLEPVLTGEFQQLAEDSESEVPLTQIRSVASDLNAIGAAAIEGLELTSEQLAQLDTETLQNFVADDKADAFTKSEMSNTVNNSETAGQHIKFPDVAQIDVDQDEQTNQQRSNGLSRAINRILSDKHVLPAARPVLSQSSSLIEDKDATRRATVVVKETQTDPLLKLRVTESAQEVARLSDIAPLIDDLLTEPRTKSEAASQLVREVEKNGDPKVRHSNLQLESGKEAIKPVLLRSTNVVELIEKLIPKDEKADFSVRVEQPTIQKPVRRPAVPVQRTSQEAVQHEEKAKSSQNEHAVSKSERATRTEQESAQKPVNRQEAENVSTRSLKVTVRDDGSHEIAVRHTSSAHEAKSSAVTVRPSGNLGQTFELSSAERIRPEITLESKPPQSYPSEIRVRIEPGDLGPIRIQLRSVNGEVIGRIHAMEPMTKHTLETQLPALREALVEHGVRVDALEMTGESSKHREGSSFDGRQQSLTQQHTSFGQGGRGASYGSNHGDSLWHREPSKLARRNAPRQFADATNPASQSSGAAQATGASRIDVLM